MASEFRLQDYLVRIAYHGPLAPDLATLTALQAAHLDAIPFETLDPWLRRPVKLDLASVQAKLVDGNRGGYCYEHNLLLRTALAAIGFQVTGLAGRVRWMAPPDSPLGPKTHMMLKVDLADGVYLADAGFGACLLDAPLRLEADIEQTTAMGTYRLTPSDGLLWLNAKRQGGWRTLTYQEMLAASRRIASALIERRLSAEKPLVILSGNSIDHALMAFGAFYAGVAFCPVSAAYSLVSKDYGKLAHVMRLLTPGLVFADDGAKFADALRANVPDGTEIVVTRGAVEGRRVTSLAEPRCGNSTAYIAPAAASVAASARRLANQGASWRNSAM